MARIDTSKENRHIIVCGGSGSGKSYFVRQKIKKINPDRLLIWDTADEYGELASKIDSINKLYDLLINNIKGRYRLVISPTDKNYINFCKLCMAWSNADHGDLMVVIEEGAATSRVGKSATGEFELITQGRKYGVIVCYVLQSLAEGSKTALKNISSLRIGISDELDIKYLQTRYGADLAERVRLLKKNQYIIFNKENKKILQF